MEFREPMLIRYFFADLDGSKREDVITMLNRLYAAEIIAKEQYRAHAVDVVGPNCIELAAMFLEHADEEDGHAKLLMTRINNLGGSLDNKLSRIMQITTTSSPDGHDVQQSPSTEQMLFQDIAGEADAIAAYTEACMLVRDYDPATYVMLAGILSDEWEHRTEWKNVLGQKV